MKIHYLYHLIVLLLFGLFLSGCVKQNNEIADSEKGVFNFVVTEAQRQYINSSRGEKYEITANNLVSITGNLNIESTGSLTVHEGSVLLIDEAVDINAAGPIVF